jgi:hypothetical protein
LARWVGGFLALAVDGSLLVVADDTDLRAACGVAAEKAVAVVRQALERYGSRTCGASMPPLPCLRGGWSSLNRSIRCFCSSQSF